MKRFLSQGEKRRWAWVFLAVFVIYLPLLLNRQTQLCLLGDKVQALLFLSGFVLTLLFFILFGWNRPHDHHYLFLIPGGIALGILLLLRLNAAERTHLIEYGILALLLQEAIRYHFRHKVPGWSPALTAFLMASGLGVLDEVIQAIIPNRTFDTRDLLFNTLASGASLGASHIIAYFSKKIRPDT